MTDNYPRGSEWRKWDLHVHTPKSIVQSYGGDTKAAWDTFIKKIATLPAEIKVLGITDYLFCEGYEYLLTRRSEIPNIELIIPNIEFRLNTFSGTANNSKRHNFHVLFDPSVSIEDIRGQLLNCLATGYKVEDKSEWNQTPTPKSLAELGKQIKAAAPTGNTVHNKTDLEVGFDNITYDRKHIEELLEKSPFKGKYITAIGYSEWDRSKWDQSAADKRNLINSAHFSLTCLADPAKIEENRKDLETNKLNSLVLHSSDAHTLDSVGQTQLWIKADPTFSGLKQVINEPKARVFIGTTPPNFKPDHKVIKKVTIPQSSGWFADGFELELNRDLVSIIGGRGSGKSALAEAIAYGAGSKDDSEDAFLKKATKHLNSISGSNITVEWTDGQTTSFEVGKLATNQGLVQYLPQGAVEELCSHKNSPKLQKQIENVIFQKLDDTERLGASNFEQLKSQVLSGFKFEKEQVVTKLQQINRRITELIGLISSLPEKEKKLVGQKEEKDKLEKSLPKLPANEEKGQVELAELNDVKKVYETKIIEIQGKLGRINDLETKVKIFKSQIIEFSSEIYILLGDLDITDNTPFLVNLNESAIKTALDDKKLHYADQLKTLKSGTKNDVAVLLEVEQTKLKSDNLQALLKAIEDKQKETRAFETTKLKYQQQKKTISTIDSSIKALEAEISKIKTDTKVEKDKLESERFAVYGSYFERLKEEKTKLEELYKPLQDSLASGTDTDKKLVFEAQVSYDIESHDKTGLNIIDRSRKGNFRELESLKVTLMEFWDEFLRNKFDTQILKNKLETILEKFTLYDGSEITISDQLREGFSEEDYYNWLFDPTYFKVVSSLKFDDTDLYVLSPGQKGIILLILYLKIDEDDYRPLIIDQPEENLDNLSVYRDLIEYFRERKQYRQIIMVTHNPNLVVNTDSEQVVIANYDGKRIPRLEYCSGSLEDQARKPDIAIDQFEDGIIERVCDILEGGETAFSSRKKKYQISNKSHI